MSPIWTHQLTGVTEDDVVIVTGYVLPVALVLAVSSCRLESVSLLLFLKMVNLLFVEVI